MKKILYIFYVLHFLFLISCGDSSDTAYSDALEEADLEESLEKTQNEEIDSAQLRKDEIISVLKDFYEWKETIDSKSFDFAVLQDDRVYNKIDPILLKKRLADFKKTNYFSDEFISNYAKIAKGIDNYLQSGEEEVEIGNMMPFGNGANPWCNCQDSPSDFWKNLDIKFLNVSTTKAKLTWSFDDKQLKNEPNYKMEFIFENGSWKVHKMQGFEHDTYFHLDEFEQTPTP